MSFLEIALSIVCVLWLFDWWDSTQTSNTEINCGCSNTETQHEWMQFDELAIPKYLVHHLERTDEGLISVVDHTGHRYKTGVEWEGNIEDYTE